MSQYHFTPQAEQDLNDIYDYVAQFGGASAARLVQRLQQSCQHLARFPGTGTPRDDLRPRMLAFAVGNHIIFYEAVSDGIRIMRIIHGARRLLPSLFNIP
jgi:toxin ParE1/3/4